MILDYLKPDINPGESLQIEFYNTARIILKCIDDSPKYTLRYVDSDPAKEVEINGLEQWKSVVNELIRKKGRVTTIIKIPEIKSEYKTMMEEFLLGDI